MAIALKLCRISLMVALTLSFPISPTVSVTACEWDSVIPLAPLWVQFKRLIKPNGAIVLFGNQPFTSELVMSNPRWFKYCWTWDKKTGKGHLVAKYRPLQQTEDIAVFGQGRIQYNPILTPQKTRRLKEYSRTSIIGGKCDLNYERMSDFLYPKTLLNFPWSPTDSLHPTQKPVDLLAYLIRTYTNPGETILDCTIGSGTTIVAAIQEGRRGVGIELDSDYFDIAVKRCADASRAARGLPKLLADDRDYAGDLPLFMAEVAP